MRRNSTYGAFGELEGRSGSTENNYLFTGEQLDENLGDYYLRQRYYASKTGRFTRRDSYEGEVFNPLSQHKYLYTHANPINYLDPSGNFTISEQVAIGVGINLLIAAASDILFPNPLQVPTQRGDFAPPNPYKLFFEIGAGIGVSVTVGIINAATRIPARGIVNLARNPVLELRRVGSALKIDFEKPVYDGSGRILREFPDTALAHGFPDVVDNFAQHSIEFNLGNGARLYQLSGSLNRVSGRFEWIVQNGAVTHRMFIQGGTINGIPTIP